MILFQRLEISDKKIRMTKLFLPGKYENLVKISEFVRLAANEAGLDAVSIYQVKTAVEEACANIIEHAYGKENVGDIECTCEVRPDELTVILHDWGKSFNPAKIRPPNLNAPLKKRYAHGLGLLFIRQWMDEVHFNFTAETGNFLTMVKHKEKVG
jgi:serine/threonine-protein kinase RsbW